MFTGIIEAIGTVSDLKTEGTNKHYIIESALTAELKIDQSVAHNGICLTVVAINNTTNTYTVTAIAETINRTNIAHWQVGTKVNMERCMAANGRFDGHIVQGHVDTIAVCTGIIDQNGSWDIAFKLKEDTLLIVPKGSITINGISLTVVNCTANTFSVSIIPYTYEYTNMHQLLVGTSVNIEFDIVGKYIQKMMNK